MESQNFDSERIELFNEALKSLLVTLQPSHDSDAARKQVVSDMQQLVTTALPQQLHCGVETFGSYRAGLHLPGSDLDFALTGWINRTAAPVDDASDSDSNDPGHSVSCVEPLEPCDSPHQSPEQWQQEDLELRGRWGDADAAAQSKQHQQQRQDERVELYQWTRFEQECLLADLADALEDRGLVQGQVERVLNARVPVIKFTHQGTGLKCDFSISRPECAFKAEMQKLLGSLDRRYAALYRLVKLWAAAHGLNDAASSTLNSWSLGLMVAFYMQCEQPALLPPIWQLLERNPPPVRAPRILQQPNVDSGALKRTLSLAATGAGAYVSRRARLGPAGVNSKTLVELLHGFFEFYGAQMVKWVNGEFKRRRASAWWGRWTDAPWPPGKPYIFAVEDPFNADDNTARSVGTHNILSCLSSASYIAWAVNTSAQLLKETLSNPAAADLVSSSSSSSNVPSQQILAAYCWLFGPTAVLQLPEQQQRVELPLPLQDALQQQVSVNVRERLLSHLQSLSDDCTHVLADSSCIACANSNNKSAADADRVGEIERALLLYKQLLRLLHAPLLDVCMSDHQIIRKREQQLAEQQREQQRQQRKQQERERQLQQRQAMQQRQQQQQQQQQQSQQQQGVVRVVPRQQSTPQFQRHAVVPVQQRSKSSSAAVGSHEVAATAAAAAVQGLGIVQKATKPTQDAGSGARSARPASAASYNTGSHNNNSSRQHMGAKSKPPKVAADGSPQSNTAVGEAAAGNARNRRAERRRDKPPYMPEQVMTHVAQYDNNTPSSSRLKPMPFDGFKAQQSSGDAFPSPPATGGVQLARAALQSLAAQGASSSSNTKGESGSKNGRRAP